MTMTDALGLLTNRPTATPRWAIECAAVLATTAEDQRGLSVQLALGSRAHDAGARDELALWASALECAWNAGHQSGLAIGLRGGAR